jgi:hypothetical protein
MVTLRQACGRVYVVAHKENLEALEAALVAEGFTVDPVRGPYTEEELSFARQMKCLVNHANVWKRVASGSETAIVVEADFVPVRGFGKLPLPFPASTEFMSGTDRDDGRFGWLYSAGSTLYGFDGHGYPYGHGNATVAYALTPRAAQHLLAFAERELAAVEPGAYRMWETYLGIYLRKEVGVLNYIPIYQYGEHGGVENPEHRAAGIRGWHQADILWRKLAFRPAYANGSTVRYRAIRLRGWARGFARQVTLRYFDPRYVNASSARGRIWMAALAVSRTFHFAGFFVSRLGGWRWVK